jgi:hypothetical protein
MLRDRASYREVSGAEDDQQQRSRILHATAEQRRNFKILSVALGALEED